MKKIVFLLLFVSGLSFATRPLKIWSEITEESPYILTATPEDFGWYEGMSPEETNTTLQNLFDTTANVVLSNTTYTTSVKLDIDTVPGQTITGNGATIQATLSGLNIVIFIDKRTSNAGKTIITDLTVDGQGNAQTGFQIWSAVEFTNVDAHDFFQHGVLAPAAGMWLQLYNDNDVYGHGDWIFESCNIWDVNSIGDNDPFNSDGSAEGFLLFHEEIVSPSNAYNIIYRNGDIYDCFGAGGTNIALFSPGLNVTNQGVTIIFENVNTYGWERRSVKAFCGNLIFRNGTTSETEANDSRFTGNYVPAGLFVTIGDSGATGAGNIIIENWDFIGNSGAEYNDNVVFGQLDGITFENVNFINGVDLQLTGAISDVTACGLVFDAGGVVGEDSSLTKVDNGNIVFDTDNVYSQSPPFQSVTNYTIIEQDLSCPLNLSPLTRSTFFGFGIK